MKNLALTIILSFIALITLAQDLEKFYMPQLQSKEDCAKYIGKKVCVFDYSSSNKRWMDAYKFEEYYRAFSHYEKIYTITNIKFGEQIEIRLVSNNGSKHKVKINNGGTSDYKALSSCNIFFLYDEFETYRNEQIGRTFKNSNNEDVAVLENLELIPRLDDDPVLVSTIRSKINNEEFIGRYSPVIDKGDIALSAASTAGGILLNIPGLGQAVSFVKGAVKDPDENRLKSGVKQIYKDSPLSYIEEGKEVVLAPDSIFVLKFKTGKDDEHEMYEGAEHADKIKEQEAKGQKLKEQNTDNQQTPAETKQKEPPLPEVIESEAVMNEPLLKPYDPYKVLREVELKTARGY